MTPIYFHVNYNEDHKFSVTEHFFATPSPLLAMHFQHQRKKSSLLVKMCTSRGYPLLHRGYDGLCFTSLLALLKGTAYYLTMLTSTVQSAEMFSRCRWMSVCAVFIFFSMWRNLIPHLCFTHTYMSNAMLSNCPSSAICTLQ